MSANAVAPDPAELSPLDEARFGVRSARAREVSAENLPDVLDFCAAHDVEFLVARCPTTDISAVHALETAGFHLMDTLLYLRFDLKKTPIPPNESDVRIRPARPDEVEQVGALAFSAFEHFHGHYHADPRLDPRKSTEVYVSWAQRCCTEPSAASLVLVAEAEGRLLGFRALRVNSPTQGEFILAGVNPEYQRRGIYRAFIVEGLRWCRERGLQEVLNSTHVANVAVQRACVRAGFEPAYSWYTFHKWFQ
ncbi:MAG: GNAT family N-acetyltransferase [Anaerolineaceae bacterium]